MIARILNAVIRAFIRWQKTVVYLAVSDDEFLARVKELVLHYDGYWHGPDAGSMRRHTVYEQLQQEFPAIAKRVISIAIEAAIQAALPPQ